VSLRRCGQFFFALRIHGSTFVLATCIHFFIGGGLGACCDLRLSVRSSKIGFVIKDYETKQVRHTKMKGVLVQ
jgi:hypothetical protein